MRGKEDSRECADVLEQLYMVYEKKMYGIAFSILGDKQQAEDTVHEAFIRLIKYLPKCRDIYGQKTKTLIVRVTKSAAIDLYRANKRQAGQISIEENEWIEDKHNVIESYLSSVSYENLISEILDKMPELYKDVVRMRYYYGMPPKEISLALGISEDNVYQRLTRARNLIKKMLGDEKYDRQKFG